MLVGPKYASHNLLAPHPCRDYNILSDLRRFRGRTYEPARANQPEDQKWTYLLEPDLRVVTKVNRLTQTMAFIILALLLTVICFMWRVDPPGGFRPPTILVAIAWIVCMVVASLAFRCHGPMEGSRAWIGADFIAATVHGPSHGLVIVTYDDIRAVALHISKDQIKSASVRAKGLTVLRMAHVKDPAIAVRAIFDHAPQQVKWRRSRFPYTRLTRDEVAALIARADLPPVDAMLPSGHTLGRKVDVFPTPDRSGKSWLARLFAKGSGGGFHALRHESPTPVTRYVSFMLLQMFDSGRTSRLLNRSEPLPALTHRDATADPVPLDDVLARLKTMCGLDLAPTTGPVDATIEATIEKTPCRFRLRFDDTADACCEIRLDDQTR